MVPNKLLLSSSSQVVNFDRFGVVNLTRFQLVSLLRQGVVNLVGACI